MLALRDVAIPSPHRRSDCKVQIHIEGVARSPTVGPPRATAQNLYIDGNMK